jgi:hypothetical protein
MSGKIYQVFQSTKRKLARLHETQYSQVVCGKHSKFNADVPKNVKNQKESICLPERFGPSKRLLKEESLSRSINHQPAAPHCFKNNTAFVVACEWKG